MYFQAISERFSNEINNVLNLDTNINSKHLRRLRKLLISHEKCKIYYAELKVFTENVSKLFMVLCKYAQQFEPITGAQHHQVRIVLEILLCVIDSFGIFDKIVRSFVTVMDSVLENYACSTNIKEFFRLYSLMLDSVSSAAIKKSIASEHKNLPILFEIVKNTDDIETQAVILEVVIKLFKCNYSAFVEEEFFQLLQVIDLPSVNKNNIYQNIRMVLDQVNENSENIFSINCTSIEINGTRVFEFKDATSADDIWLDFNLNQKRMSFFVYSELLAACFGVQLTPETTFEMLSFAASSVIKPVFKYNSATEQLEFCFKVRMEDIFLFGAATFGTVQSIKICLSRYSSKFYKLMEIILPSMFLNYDFEMLAVPSETSTIPDLNHSNENKVLKNIASSDSQSVIYISNNENEILDNTVTCQAPETRERCATAIYKMNRSISPLSCTESLFRPESRHSDREVPTVGKIYTLEEHHVVRKKVATYVENPSHERICSLYHVLKTRIATNVEIPAPSSKRKKLGEEQLPPLIENPEKKMDLVVKRKRGRPRKVLTEQMEKIVEIANDNKILDIASQERPSEIEDNVEEISNDARSNSKVENWLGQLPDVFNAINSQQQFSSQDFQKHMLPEEKIELLMRGEKRDENELQKDVPISSTENLLRILDSQGSSQKQNEKDWLSDDSDIPLSVLKSKKKKTSGPISEHDIFDISSQSFSENALILTPKRGNSEQNILMESNEKENKDCTISSDKDSSVFPSSSVEQQDHRDDILNLSLQSSFENEGISTPKPGKSEQNFLIKSKKRKNKNCIILSDKDTSVLPNSSVGQQEHVNSGDILNISLQSSFENGVILTPKREKSVQKFFTKSKKSENKDSIVSPDKDTSTLPNPSVGQQKHVDSDDILNLSLQSSFENVVILTPKRGKSEQNCLTKSKKRENKDYIVSSDKDTSILPNSSDGQKHIDCNDILNLSLQSSFENELIPTPKHGNSKQNVLTRPNNGENKDAISSDKNISLPSNSTVERKKDANDNILNISLESSFEKELIPSSKHTNNGQNISLKSLSDNNVSKSSTKKKLYNPNDYSYLENMMTSDYVRSTSPDRRHTPISEVVSSTKKKNRKKDTNTKSTLDKIKKKKKVNTSVTLDKIKKQKKPNPLLPIWKYKDPKPLKKSKGLFTQVYNNLLKEVEENDKRKAERRNKQNASNIKAFPRKTPNYRTKKKQKFDENKKFNGFAKLHNPQDTSMHQVNGKRESYDTSIEEAHPLVQDIEQNKVENNQKLGKNQKINILSNILIQSGSSQPSYKHCSDTVSEIYLGFLQHLKQCNPELLRSTTCQTIANILQDIN